MFAYAKFRGVDLPHTVGVNSVEGLRRADGRSGHLIHGPHINLMPGAYCAAFYARRDAVSDMGGVEVDVCCDRGERQLARRSFSADDICVSIPGLLKLDFDVGVCAKACEVRMHVPEDFIVEVRDLVIFKRSQSNWGAP